MLILTLMEKTTPTKDSPSSLKKMPIHELFTIYISIKCSNNKSQAVKVEYSELDRKKRHKSGVNVSVECHISPDRLTVRQFPVQIGK